MHERPTYTRSYAAALWLVAKGFEPLSAEMSRDGSGGVLFLFSNDARDALANFHQAKDRLNVLSLDARGNR